MPKPARLPTRHIEVNRLQAEPLSKLLGGYMVVPGVLARDSAHSAQALCMEAAESPPQYLREALAFTAEENDGEYEPLVHRVLRLKRHRVRAEDAVP